MPSLADLIKDEREKQRKIEEKSSVDFKSPKRIIIKEEQKIIDESFWIELAKSSDFKRLVYRGIKGKVWRGSNQELNASLEKMRNIINKKD